MGNFRDLSSQEWYDQVSTALMEPGASRCLPVPPRELTQDASGLQTAKLLHGSNSLGQFLLCL